MIMNDLEIPVLPTPEEFEVYNKMAEAIKKADVVEYDQFDVLKALIAENPTPRQQKILELDAAAESNDNEYFDYDDGMPSGWYDCDDRFHLDF